ncbi:MAG: DUF1365 domain-containing protein [Acidobacteriota bacterium]
MTEASQISSIYVGRVRHRRFEPRLREFSYRMFLVFLDLDELPEVLDTWPFGSARRPAMVRYRATDYLPERTTAGRALSDAARDLVAERTGERPSGPVRLLTHLRTLGFAFNPVSFYYCYAADGSTLEAIIAEITNTPWDERYSYVLTADASETEASSGMQVVRQTMAKQFHVSPFQPMEQTYRWRFTAPGERLAVHMENYRQDAASDGVSASDEKVFDATLQLERRAALGRRALASAQLRHPAMTWSVLAAIYAQAARLWLRRTPFHRHPANRPSADTPAGEGAQ